MKDLFGALCSLLPLASFSASGVGLAFGPVSPGCTGCIHLPYIVYDGG